MLKWFLPCKSTSQSQAMKWKQKEPRASTRNPVCYWWEAVNGSYVAILEVWMIINGWMFQKHYRRPRLCINLKWYVSRCYYEYTHSHMVIRSHYTYCWQACDCFLPHRCEYYYVCWLENQTMKMIRFEFKLQKKFVSWTEIYKKEDLNVWWSIMILSAWHPMKIAYTYCVLLQY
jgi:hypothetical protein